MEEYICNRCNFIFDKQWKLTKHNSGKRKCKPVLEREEHECDYCHNKYSSNSNLTRHKKVCRMNTQANQSLDNPTQVNNNNTIPIHDNNLPITLDTTSNTNVNVGNSNTTTTTNSNNTTNINMPNFIYPFGFEDMSYITDDEKLRILTCKNPIIECIKVIYSKPQNCNIYRPNSNKDNVKVIELSLINHNKNFENERYIEQEFPVDVSDTSDAGDASDNEAQNNSEEEEESIHNFPRQDESSFEEDIEDEEEIQNRKRRIVRKEKTGLDKYDVSLEPTDFSIAVENVKYSDISKRIIKNSKEFLLRLLHSCKFKLTFPDQLCIVENITENSIKVSNDFYLKYIVNFLETHFTDIIYKDIFKKYNVFIKTNESFKINTLEIVKKIINELRCYFRNKGHESLDEEFLTSFVWTKEKERTPEASIEDERNNLQRNDLENTPRYKFFEEMKEIEMKFFSEHGITIGNIYKYRKILLDRAQREIDIMETEYNNAQIKQAMIGTLINDTRYNMLNRLQDIRFIDPSNLVAGLDTKRFAKLSLIPKLAPDCDINYIKNITEEELKLLDKLLSSAVLNTDAWNNFENEKDQLTKYKDITYDGGLVGVRYKRANDYKFGRVYPSHSLSLCSLRREIRHTIARDLFVDVDISNAHCEFIYQTAKYHGIKCSTLEEYVKNREEKLQEVMNTYKVSRDLAKDLFIILLYFGSFQTWLNLTNLNKSLKPNEFISKYIEERTHYGEWIESKNELIAYDIQQAKVRRNILDYNEKASVVSIWCQEIEQRILYELYIYCKVKKYIGNDSIGVLCFDGIMIKKENYQPSILEEFSKCIERKLGYKLIFVKKELNQGYNELLAGVGISNNNASHNNNNSEADSSDGEAVNSEEENSSGDEDANSDKDASDIEEQDELEESDSINKEQEDDLEDIDEEQEEDFRRVLSQQKKKEKKKEAERIKQQDKEFLKSLEIISHQQCAAIFYKQNPKKYIYSSTLGWLVYNEYNVIECNGKEIPDNIKSSITSELHKFLIPIRNRMKPNSPSYVKDSKNINKLIKDCSNSKFLAGVIDFLAEMYVVREIDKKLDTNPNLFAFDDKVYDLSTYSIRDITPNDFIYKTTKYKYSPSNPEIRNRLVQFIKNIFMIDDADTDGLDVYNYYLTTKAHSLFGNKLEACYITPTEKKNENYLIYIYL